MKKLSLFAFFFTLLFLSSSAFDSDELLLDDEEFGIEGRAQPAQPQVKPHEPATTTTRKRLSDSDSDSKIQFSLEHAFGDSDFTPAGTFSARLKTASHGGQMKQLESYYYNTGSLNEETLKLTKLRISRNQFLGVEKEKFEKLLQDDDFYRIRLPSNPLKPS
ncbi:hypothetical protein Pint_21213 [Pistacia integerrima]|uniref:Uncharacterized protein n=1 Tax=Pistacia integerrima TaxID=434235 RepID=A0ACC0XE94_9ROSI|nr:hypothetical protein Pint_21213 [Pistacia integerrima]